MQVFQRIHDRLVSSGDVLPGQIVAPEGDGLSPTNDELSLVHSREYLEALTGPAGLDPARSRRIGFGADAFSAEQGGRRDLLLRRTRAEAAGTLLAARLALERGLAVATAGGTHHARASSGAGYCVINDLAFAAATLVAEGAVGRVAIVDADVHQGDGTASVMSLRGGGASSSNGSSNGSGNGSGGGGSGNPPDEEDAASPVPAWIRERVFTLSVHAANNFPARKERSTLDVGLPDGCGDAEYLSAVARTLERVLDWLQQPMQPPQPPLSAAAASKKPLFRPSLVLFDAGVDVHALDCLGRLAVTDAGLRRREMMVLDCFLAAGVPVAGVVGGGYADDLDVLAERHMHLHRAALEMWEMHGLGGEEEAEGGGRKFGAAGRAGTTEQRAAAAAAAAA